MKSGSIYRLLAACLLGILISACGASKTDTDSANEASLLAVEVTDVEEVEKFDLNGDGTADVTKTYTRLGTKETPDEDRERVLARTELDVNFDGATDMRQFFNKIGAMVREEMDLDFDGKTDAIDYFREGVVFKRAVFLNFTESPSVWKFYEEGVLVKKERDTNGNSKADTFEVFEEGKIVRVGYDRNGDGQPDYWDEVEIVEE